MSSSRELTLIEHLGELRRRVFICLTALIIGAVVAFYFWTELLELLKWPAQDLINQGVVTPIVTQVTERLSTAVKISMVAGFVLALPVILYQVVRFVAPGLMPGERRYLFLFMPGALLAFFCGLAFAYFVLTPRAIPFLLTFGGDVAQTQIRISNLVDVMLRLLLWMGLAFETPVIMYLLAQLGIVSSRMFARFRKYWVVIAFILGAIITPTFDPLNQTLVAAPLLALYEIGIFLAWLAGRARQRAVMHRPQYPSMRVSTDHLGSVFESDVSLFTVVWLDSSSPVTELLKLRIPLPSDDPISGNLLAPKISRTINKIIRIWGSPIGPKPMSPPKVR